MRIRYATRITERESDLTALEKEVGSLRRCACTSYACSKAIRLAVWQHALHSLATVARNCNAGAA